MGTIRLTRHKGILMTEIRALTGVRGFAALWVVLLHYRYGDLADEYGAWSFLFRRGGLGVPLFFVLSGFMQARIPTKGSAIPKRRR
jgi:peptidoglycan/LPS O-acetylase OafA/YrhL